MIANLETDLQDLNRGILRMVRAASEKDLVSLMDRFGLDTEAVKTLRISDETGMDRASARTVALWHCQHNLAAQLVTIADSMAAHGASDAISEEVELRLTYLLLLQRVAQASVTEASIRFGVDEEEATAVRDAPMRHLHELARRPTSHLKPREILLDVIAAKSNEHARAGALIRSIVGARQ